MGHLHGSVALAKNNGTLLGPAAAGSDGLENGKSLFADWILSVRLMRYESFDANFYKSRRRRANGRLIEIFSLLLHVANSCVYVHVCMYIIQ